MSVQILESSRLEPFPFPLHASGCATAGLEADAERDRVLLQLSDFSPGEVPAAVGCLRGFCWAVVLEAVAALCVFAVWHLG
jgi:hypothetical protein